jgi:hypothetical protein
MYTTCKLRHAISMREMASTVYEHETTCRFVRDDGVVHGREKHSPRQQGCLSTIGGVFCI